MKNRIKECRRAHEMSRMELAGLAGFSYDAICKWENGKRNISVTSAEQLAKALHVSPAYLVGWTDAK